MSAFDLLLLEPLRLARERAAALAVGAVSSRNIGFYTATLTGGPTPPWTQVAVAATDVAIVGMSTNVSGTATSHLAFAVGAAGAEQTIGSALWVDGGRWSSCSPLIIPAGSRLSAAAYFAATQSAATYWIHYATL